jgi:hypothetical protein
LGFFIGVNYESIISSSSSNRSDSSVIIHNRRILSFIRIPCQVDMERYHALYILITCPYMGQGLVFDVPVWSIDQKQFVKQF